METVPMSELWKKVVVGRSEVASEIARLEKGGKWKCVCVTTLGKGQRELMFRKRN
jgi:hypothetical protein